QTGTFVMPTLIELENFAELEKEVFGPVLHVVRYNRNLEKIFDAQFSLLPPTLKSQCCSERT
ncbi:hypothetical protein MJI95_08410, partial [Salmonella enterica subsp. enterica serovar Kentucky]|nr:hypothetical protein [Salmonella enterica subsp. enterica serovar Kentucky]